MAKALVIKGANFATNKVTTISFDGAHTTAVDVSPSSAELTTVGGTTLLSATVTPSNSVDPVVWSSSNTSVATVANGLVTAVGVGSCTITATSGSYSDTCSVVVSVDTYLTGTAVPTTIVDPAQSGNNALTKTTCDIGRNNSSYNGFLSMVDSVQSYTNELLCANMAKNTATSPNYDFEIVEPESMEDDTNMKRCYDYIGYPMPMSIPTGTTKIKCIGLSASYGARAIFFDTSKRALDTKENVNGGAYYMAYRKKYTPTAADYTWVYENNLEFDVPTENGFTYDGVVVVWKTDPNDSSAVLPKDMTAEQLAEFKVQCLSS